MCVFYTGFHPDGTIFDSNEQSFGSRKIKGKIPLKFKVGTGRVIKAVSTTEDEKEEKKKTRKNAGRKERKKGWKERRDGKEEGMERSKCDSEKSERRTNKLIGIT